MRKRGSADIAALADRVIRHYHRVIAIAGPSRRGNRFVRMLPAL
jgi:hypothetical protein